MHRNTGRLLSVILIVLNNLTWHIFKHFQLIFGPLFFFPKQETVSDWMMFTIRMVCLKSPRAIFKKATKPFLSKFCTLA